MDAKNGSMKEPNLDNLEAGLCGKDKTTYNTTDATFTHDPFLSNSYRTSMIGKVYGLLTLQLIYTFGMVAIFALDPEANKWARDNVWFFIVMGLMGLIMIISLFCYDEYIRIYPHNCIFLAFFTGFMGLLVAGATAGYQNESVLYAAMITLLITGLMSLVAIFAPFDLTGAGGFLMSGLISLIILGIVTSILCGTGNSACNTMNMVYTWFGILIFCMYIVYDTQKIIGGEHKKYSYAQDDYVMAAIALYLDIINLFLLILRLIGKKK